MTVVCIESLTDILGVLGLGIGGTTGIGHGEEEGEGRSGITGSSSKRTCRELSGWVGALGPVEGSIIDVPKAGHRAPWKGLRDDGENWGGEG